MIITFPFLAGIRTLPLAGKVSAGRKLRHSGGCRQAQKKRGVRSPAEVHMFVCRHVAAEPAALGDSPLATSDLQAAQC